MKNQFIFLCFLIAFLFLGSLLIYVFSVLSTELSEIKLVLREKIPKLEDSLLDIESRLTRLERRETELFKTIDPWESCMRIKHRQNCLTLEDELREDLPPCSTTILKDIILSLTSTLEKTDIIHWISYGTLLGAARNGTIIPWTSDVDVVVKGSDFPRLDYALKKSSALLKLGLWFFL